MRTNIRQVAERAGVSRTTVSNVLLGRHDLVTADKREAVLRAARELEYVPVRSSLQNRHVPTRVLALALDDPRQVSYSFHSSTYSGMCEAALRHGYDVLTLLRADPDWVEDRREVSLLDRRSDGIAFIAPESGELSTFEALARHGIPTVACYRRDVPEGVAWVDPDNRAAMSLAVEHLREHGHGRIAHLTYEVPRLKAQFDFVERGHAFSAAMIHFGLPEGAGNIITVARALGSGSPDLRRRLVECIVASKASALVCAHDWLALEAWHALDEAGLRVPQDISLIGVDDAPEAAPHGLSTLGFSYAQIGRLAVDALVAQLQGQPARLCCHSVPMQLQARRSVKAIQ